MVHIRDTWWCFTSVTLDEVFHFWHLTIFLIYDTTMFLICDTWRSFLLVTLDDVSHLWHLMIFHICVTGCGCQVLAWHDEVSHMWHLTKFSISDIWQCFSSVTLDVSHLWHLMPMFLMWHDDVSHLWHLTMFLTCDDNVFQMRHDAVSSICGCKTPSYLLTGICDMTMFLICDTWRCFSSVTWRCFSSVTLDDVSHLWHDDVSRMYIVYISFNIQLLCDRTN